MKQIYSSMMSIWCIATRKKYIQTKYCMFTRLKFLHRFDVWLYRSYVCQNKAVFANLFPTPTMQLPGYSFFIWNVMLLSFFSNITLCLVVTKTLHNEITVYALMPTNRFKQRHRMTSRNNSTIHMYISAGHYILLLSHHTLYDSDVFPLV